MNKKKFHRAREIFKIKNSIYKLIPSVQDIDIKITQAEGTLFESLIMVKIDNRKNLIATKSSESLKLALEKAHQAIIKQIKKIKDKRLRKRHKTIEELQTITPNMLFLKPS